MKLTLSENIRRFRKERKMTQEKLAEILGVTVGAVYKWESGLTMPELNLIVEMADFFDTSVDVLLGYKMKDNHLNAALERIEGYCRKMDPAALSEAEKVLGKYPNSFRAVYACASVYLIFGSSHHDPELLRRSLDLLEQARVLLPQNDDPRISEAVVCGNISIIWFLLNEREKCLEILKRYNAGSIFSSQIGAYLAVYMNRPEEAAPFLTEALLTGISDLLTTIFGYIFLFCSRCEWDSALRITTWGTDILAGLSREATPDFLDKTQAEMLALLSCVQMKAGMPEASRDSLRKAGQAAHRFDSSPDYTIKAMPFADPSNPPVLFDILGATASESISALIGLLNEPELSGMWEEIVSHEQ